jgi:hypothetical protein
MNKNRISEATGAGASGSFKSPASFAPIIWNTDQTDPFTIPVSEYLNATLAYDSYDGTMDISKKEINSIESKTKKLAMKSKKDFQQTDDDGNNFNGYNPPGPEGSGTPDYIKKMAHLSKSDTKPIYDNKDIEANLKEDLGVWFGTKKKPKGSKQPAGPWVNICRKVNGKHPPCGRSHAEDKGYPKCRAAGVASKMSASEKKSACQQKRKAEKTHSKSGTGNKPKMVSYKPKNEQLTDIIRRVIRENFN